MRLIWALICTSFLATPLLAGTTQVRDQFAKLQQAGKFNGSVLIARGDRILLDQPFGYADFENQVKLGPSSIFRIGSLSKPVTASAVLIAVDKGELSLNTRLCDVIAYCLPSWRPVTVENLLSHTAGIPDHFRDMKAVPVGRTEAELQRMISGLNSAEPLKAAPGTTYDYSNFNYILLGIVLEHVRKQGWRDVIAQQVVSPAHATTLDYDDVYALLPHRVRGYDRSGDGHIMNIVYKDHAAYAAGGLRSNIDDFFHWSRASLQARLFSPALRDLMITPRKGRYGLGWQITRFLGHNVYDHTGGVDGFSTHIAYYPNDDVTILVFTNVETDNAALFACDAAAYFFGVQRTATKPRKPNGDLAPSDRCGLTS